MKTRAERREVFLEAADRAIFPGDSYSFLVMMGERDAERKLIAAFNATADRITGGDPLAAERRCMFILAEAAYKGLL